jgi:hypothetical protein
MTFSPRRLSTRSRAAACASLPRCRRALPLAPPPTTPQRCDERASLASWARGMCARIACSMPGELPRLRRADEASAAATAAMSACAGARACPAPPPRSLLTTHRLGLRLSKQSQHISAYTFFWPGCIWCL